MSEEIKPVPFYPDWKRFLQSGVRAFLSGFIPVFLLFLGQVHKIDDLTSQALSAVLFGAVIAGVSTTLKFIQEKWVGRI